MAAVKTLAGVGIRITAIGLRRTTPSSGTANSICAVVPGRLSSSLNTTSSSFLSTKRNFADDLDFDIPAPPSQKNYSRNTVKAESTLATAAQNLQTQMNVSEIIHKLPVEPFPKEIQEKITAPLDPNDVEIKPDGTLYLPEIKYRRLLNNAFGSGGWSLVPLSPPIVVGKNVEREFALFVNGKFISTAMGDHEFMGIEASLSKTHEAAKSRAIMRVCKDIGFASELWDPNFVIQYKSTRAADVWVENVKTKEKKKMWKRKDRVIDAYPWKEQNAK